MKTEIKVTNINKVLASFKKLNVTMLPDLQEVIKGGAQTIWTEAINLIQKGAKSGITYKKYNPSRTHTASAPGQAPASDTGFLASQITMDVNVKPNGTVVGQIISAAPYSKHLEFGTVNMTERPFMQPALMKNKRKIQAMFKKGILKWA